MNEILDNKTGNIIISIILGLGLAALFRKSCEGGQCVVFKAPPKDIEKKIYKHNGKCIKFKSESVKCSKKSIQ